MLKWLNKVKNWLQGEEIIEIEEIIEESINPENKWEMSSNHLKEENSRDHHSASYSNEIDSKVLFQYPKGQFKFPLIPDESLPKRRVKEKEEKHQPSIHAKPKCRPSDTHTKAVAFEKKPKIETSKKPFRPTQIPSPVYGFHKAMKHPEEVVEYELDSKPIDSPITKQALEVPAYFRKEQIDSPLKEKKLQQEVEEMTYTAVQLNPFEDEPVISEKNLSMERTGEKTQEETSIHDQVETLELHEKSWTDMQAATGNEQKVEEQKMMMNPVRENHNETVPTEEVNEPIVDRQEQPQTRKKHIPFNVLMLKQDHQRINFQSQDQEKKTEKSKVIGIESEAEKRIVEEEKTLKDLSGDDPLTPVSIEKEINEEIKAEELPIEEKLDVEEEGNPYYMFPNISLLTPPASAENDEEWLEEQGTILDDTLKNFNVRARVVNVTQGPAVTRFEVYPEPGVKVNKVTNLMDDIKLSLAAQDIRMEAPIPGKHTIGIEIPNRKSKPVFLREVLESKAFQSHSSPLAVAMGLDISGQPIVTDLRKMPHGLIAGQTGSGKSVCINTMLISLLYKATPQELKLMLIDPKMVELAPYNRIPHLVSPVITDVKAATAALKWAVEEMERRYELFVHAGVRDITKFNERAEITRQFANKLPYILIVIDELADLMMMSPADVEDAICRIAQKARACGIHLIVATQRPSVDVITGLIKANIPTRIAFSVSSQVDSRTIIDSGGAEKLLGRGDMLFAENGSSKTVRLQGTFVSDDEIDKVVQHVKNEQQPNYLFEQEELLTRTQVSEETDELFIEACEFVVSQNAASTSSIQRHFRVGYNRAARLIEMMEQQGVISESRGSKARDVLISEEDLEYLQ